VAGDRTQLGPFIVIALTGATLVLVVYYNLVTALVARREDLVLKRLRCGELSDAEILAGSVAPGVVIAWAQILVGALAAATVFAMPVPVNGFLVVVGILLGTAVLLLLALASAGLTRSVPSAELTTTPLLVASLALGGLMVPLDAFPDGLQRVGQVMPLTPVIDLVRLGLTGIAPDGEIVDVPGTFLAAALPAGVLLGWLALGGWAAKRWFRWEPRR
jgi:ABC-2 type transport system permease protein